MPMGIDVVELRFADAAALERHWNEHLCRGGAWVEGELLAADRPCELVLIGPGGDRMVLVARVVLPTAAGSGLALDGFGPELRARLEAFVAAAAADDDEAAAGDAEAGEPFDATADAHTAGAPTDGDLDGGPDDGADDAPDGDDAADPGSDGDLDAPHHRAPPRNLHERLRNLSPAEQHKIARGGEPHERMVLERIYGKAVWDPLLRNPRLTHPEVARIARMGALPRPLVELIVGNGSWLQSGEVRRALLANPRLGTDQILRVLRLLPKHELKLVPSQTAYPSAVRDAARRLLRG